MRLVLLSLAALLLASCTPRPSPAVAQCLAELDRRLVRYELVASHPPCAVAGAVQISATTLALDQPAVVECRFALRLDDFAREVVAPLALAWFGESVRVIRHFGAYSCRTTRSGGASLHAQGRAIDIAGFVLTDGTVITVERDWRGRSAASAFLHDIAHAACARFSMVLTPDSDADHFNHIHLDDGPYRRCGA